MKTLVIINTIWLSVITIYMAISFVKSIFLIKKVLKTSLEALKDLKTEEKDGWRMMNLEKDLEKLDKKIGDLANLITEYAQENCMSFSEVMKSVKIVQEAFDLSATIKKAEWISL